ncbi:PREDICTED: scarecrow-like protein 26 isoform X2 [Tarenaya hassleriana]|uniref:scarecrow-like protein 26 isoform X1 n=1 Tax=Tarenaya hassleriana TaxID=28532 RepID=UPI00053C781C|nr:PREDICTED: scarecrow-like protein 26 isoform X1 [Tarenaya hassleriana]XP_010544542.1 PREDICTED: scarecrow-like protein 26 isoform X2 [Tarenaya hassleriana]
MEPVISCVALHGFYSCVPILLLYIYTLHCRYHLLTLQVQHCPPVAMAFPDDDFLDLLFSDHTAVPATAASAIAASTTTTTISSGEEQGNNWNDWSPVMDWSSDFRDLIDSIMADEATIMDPSPRLLAYDHDQEVCNSTSTDSMMMMVTDAVDLEDPKPDDLKGLRLVHLLMAAAEALTGAHKTQELTRVILARLKELVSPGDRTNMERLAFHFTDGLSSLLERATNTVKRRQGGGSHLHREVRDHVDVVAAFQLFQDMSPYVNFGYLTANQAILEAVGYERRIHIVDYDIMEGVQWSSFMQALVTRKAGPPVQHLRVTALSQAINGRKSVAAVQEAGRRLASFAESVGQPFSFHHCKLDSDETFNSSSLKLVRGEALVINCMLHLPRFSYQTPNSLVSFLSETKTLNPKLVTLVHEEVGMSVDQGFTTRFMDLLHQFSAIFDSLEAGFPVANPARGFVERAFLGPWISAWLTRIAAATENSEVESFLSWSRWLETNGFNPVDVSFTNCCQAKLLLSLFSDGYKVEELGRNGIVLGWKSRRLVSASFWASPEPNL